MTYFPYDTQTCNIDVSEQVYTIDRCILFIGKTDRLLRLFYISDKCTQTDVFTSVGLNYTFALRKH